MPGLRDDLEQRALAAEAVNDPSASFLRSLVIRCDIEQQRDKRVEEMLETAERIAGGAIAAKAAEKLPGAIDRAFRLRFGGYLAATALVFAGGLFGATEYGKHLGRAETLARVQHAVDAIPAAAIRDGPAAAKEWLTLMQNNDIVHSIHTCGIEARRRVCAVSLWMEGTDPPGLPSTPGNRR